MAVLTSLKNIIFIRLMHFLEVHNKNKKHNVNIKNITELAFLYCQLRN
jgi:hypothetical protein